MKVKMFKPGDLVRTKCGQIGIIDDANTNNYMPNYDGIYYKKDKDYTYVPTYSMHPLKGNKFAWFDHEELILIESNFSKNIVKKYS